MTSALKIDASRYYGDFYHPENFMEMKDGSEEYWHWPLDGCHGFFYVTKLRPGLILTITKHKSAVPVDLDFTESSRSFHLSFGLSGKIHVDLAKKYCVPSEDVLDFGTSYLAYLPKSSGIARYPAESYLNIALLISPWFMKRFLQKATSFFTDAVDKAVSHPDSTVWQHQIMLTPLMKIRLYEIFSCPYQGSARHYFLESKALELILLAAGQVETISHHYSCFARKQPDYIFAEKAREIILSDTASPPSLSELASRVGVNKGKLNRCFREVYGTSVFEYLRICRLEKAKSLLLSGHKNVKEVAFESGYTEPGNFSKEFKKYFGVSPISCLD